MRTTLGAGYLRKGAVTIEMTLVGIPLIFALISVCEMARGMWIYHTLTHAVREGTRYASVHGQGCGTNGNSCATTVGQIAAIISSAAVGLDPAQLKIQMQSTTDDTTLLPAATLIANTKQFPTGTGAQIQSPITFAARYPFQSAIAMFWPGAGRGMNFMSVTLPATSRETIRF